MAANRTAGTHSAPRTDFGNWGKISGSAELPGSCGRYSSFGTTDDRYNKNDLESAFVPPNLPHARILEVAADCARRRLACLDERVADHGPNAEIAAPKR